MKVGQIVNYYNPSSGREDALIVEINKPGPSGAKTLDLQIGQGDSTTQIEAVSHGRDRQEGGSFWLQKGDRAPTGWAEEAHAEEEKEEEDEPVKRRKKR